MRLFAFLGLGAVVALFTLTSLLSNDNYYVSDCTCQALIPYKDTFLLISLGLALFFLLFCVFLLTKSIDIRAYWKKQNISDTELTNKTHHSLFQLPLMQAFSRMSIISSIGIFILIIVAIYTPYQLIGNCDSSKCTIYSLDNELYLSFYGITGLYLSFLSFMVYRNISKYKAQGSNF